MSLSTHVKHISLNQWRYYYNQLLFVDVPLSANFMQELMPPKGNSPTIEITPIKATDDISESAYGSDSEPLSTDLSTEALSFAKLVTQLPCENFNQKLVVNIYSNIVLNKAPENNPVAVIELATHRTTDKSSELSQVSALLAGLMAR